MHFLHPNEHYERICLYLVRQFEAKLAKIGHIFTKESFTRMVEKINALNESCSHTFDIQVRILVSRRLSHIWPIKLTVKSENALVLPALPQTVLQDTKKSFQDVH